MPKFIMMCGPAASGKSTMAEKFMEEARSCELEENSSWVYLSSDKMREDLFDDVNDQKHNGLIFQNMNNSTKRYLSQGYNVIYDATNLVMKRRMALLEMLKNIPCEKICCVMVARFRILCENDANRKRHVGESVLKKHLKQFQCPQYFEGWDKIIFKSCVNAFDFDCVDYLSRLHLNCKIDQDNHHHQYTVEEHQKKARDYILEKYPDKHELSFAAYCHDIGKPFCKDFHDSRGNSSTEAHYYGHQNVGAYLMLSAWIPFFEQPEKLNSLLYIIGLINYHMEPYIRKEHYPKFEKLLDKKLAAGIALLHEADVAAH